MSEQLTSHEERELAYLYQEYEKTICSCCPEYRLAEWKRARLVVLEDKFRQRTPTTRTTP